MADNRAWPAPVEGRFDFLNQGCEYLDLELREPDNSQEFTESNTGADRHGGIVECASSLVQIRPDV